MEYSALGATGLTVSSLAFGTAPLGDLFGAADDDQGQRAVQQALEAGITFFDSSVYYGNGLAEERLGRALRGRRDDVVLMTKAGRFGPDDFDFSPGRLRASLEESLRLLQTDHVDIFLVHDIEFVPLEPVLTDSFAELQRLRDEGKCRFIGASGYPLATLRRVITETPADVVLSYGHGTLLDGCLDHALLPLAAEHDVAVVNAAAVCLGLLTPRGSFLADRHPATPAIKAAAERARETCRRHDADVAFLANQYAIQRGGCPTTVVGTTKPHHLQAAVEAAQRPIDEQLLAEVLTAVGDVRGQDWASGLPENN